MSSGVIGPYKDYLITYPMYQQDPKKHKSFEEVWPDINDFMRLRDRKSADQMAKNAAAALLSFPSANKQPKWLQEIFSGNTEHPSKR